MATDFLSFKYSSVKNSDKVTTTSVVIANDVKVTLPLSAEEMARATEAYKVCGLLGHPGKKQLKKGIANGTYCDCG